LQRCSWRQHAQPSPSPEPFIPELIFEIYKTYFPFLARPQVYSNTDTQQSEIRFLHHLHPPPTVPQIARDHQLSHQQIESDNRLQQLELIRPKDNINLLNIKFRSLQNSHHARPSLPQYHDAYVNTFYDQTGTYIQERSGLYHTENYDPNALTQSIPELENCENNQEDNDNLLKDESNLADLLAYNEQIQNKSKPKLFQYKAIGDHQTMRVCFDYLIIKKKIFFPL